MKINGWKRLGIIASVTWILVAGGVTFTRTQNADIKQQLMMLESCEASHHGTAPECDDMLHRGDAEYMRLERETAALVALVPVPIGWAFVYLVLFLTRWVKRGFDRVVR
jgi:hypothetical protein